MVAAFCLFIVEGGLLYYVNYLGRKEYQSKSDNEIFGENVLSLAILLLAVIVGFVAPSMTPFVLLVIKTAFDLLYSTQPAVIKSKDRQADII